MTDTDSQRLFLALWPDDTTRDALHRTGKWLHKHWGGRLMRRDTLHLTLAFLGNTPVNRLDALTAYVGSVDIENFELILDQAGCWPHNHIGWLGATEKSVPLLDLTARLRIALRKADLHFEDKPFVPHVTLLRNTRGGAATACEPVRWPISGFALLASDTNAEGACYTVLRRWP
ncbi:MAG: RNA 2',3'-cyclic phosphodiesterase [Thiobacillus sp.]